MTPEDTSMPSYYRGVTVPEEERPRIYMVMNFTRGERQRLLKARTGCINRLYSYYKIGVEIKNPEPVFEELDTCRELGFNLFLDSGAHTFQNRTRAGSGTIGKNDYALLDNIEEEREQYKQEYIAFCREHGHRFDVYANFDYVEHSPTVWELQEELEGQGIAPIPTVHGDSGLEWMHRYIDKGYTYLGIGAGHRWGSKTKVLKYLDAVFDIAAKTGTHLHGYGMTAPEQIARYPWYSVDSSTWLKMAANGWVLIVYDNGKMDRVRATFTEPGAMPWVAKFMAERDFDFELMKIRERDRTGAAYMERSAWNMWMMSHLDEFDIKYDDGASRKGWTGFLGDR